MELRPTFRLHPVVEANLARYMSEHPQETEHYRRMVKEYPEHAVKTIMCRKMIQEDELRDLATRLKPLVKNWISETPGLHDRIMERIKAVRPLHSNIAYVEEALKEKTLMVHSPPRVRTGKGISLD
jgi:hypothetical protein